MNTPDTEWKAKMQVETLHSILADISSFEPDGEVYTLVEQAHTELAKLRTLISSRDTYWKERVRKEINEISRHWIEEATRNPDNFEVRIKLDALDTLLDNLK